MQGIELDGAHSQHHDSLTVTHFSTEHVRSLFGNLFFPKSVLDRLKTSVFLGRTLSESFF